VGSHYIFRAEIDEQVWRLSIPFNKPIKIIYVKEALAAIDEISQVIDDEEESDDDSTD
jgi:hypothetical protein